MAGSTTRKDGFPHLLLLCSAAPRPGRPATWRARRLGRTDFLDLLLMRSDSAGPQAGRLVDLNGRTDSQTCCCCARPASSPVAPSSGRPPRVPVARWGVTGDQAAGSLSLTWPPTTPASGHPTSHPTPTTPITAYPVAHRQLHPQPRWHIGVPSPALAGRSHLVCGHSLDPPPTPPSPKGGADRGGGSGTLAAEAAAGSPYGGLGHRRGRNMIQS